ALLERAGDHSLVLLELRAGGDRTHLGLREQRVAQLDALRAPLEPLEKRVVNGLLHEGARAGDTGLPGRGEDARQYARFRLVEIRVGEHDVRALSAELERARREPCARLRRDRLSARLAP